MAFQRGDVEFSDDSDDGSRIGPVGQPHEPQPPGIHMEWPEIPVSYFYDLANQEQPRVAQPAYIRFPVGLQLWHIFNANALPLGRMTSRAAQYVTNKNSPFYNHSMLSSEEEGEFVVIVNGKTPMLLGNKGKFKMYKSHSKYPGGLKERDIRQVLEGYHWDKVVKLAVSGMLPKNNLRKKYLERVFVYPDLYHDFEFLPQFQYRAGVDHSKELGYDDLLTSPDTEIIYANTEIPDELKHMKLNLGAHPEIEVPFHLREEAPKAHSKQDARKLRRYYRLMRRYRVFNYQTKKFEIR